MSDLSIVLHFLFKFEKMIFFLEKSIEKKGRVCYTFIDIIYFADNTNKEKEMCRRGK